MKKKLMQWTYFLDILGFGEEQKSIDTQKKADEFMEFMKINKSLIDWQENIDIKFYSDKNINIYDYYDFKSVFISDSFVLTAIPKETKFNEENYYHFSTQIIMELTFKILILIEHILTEKGLLLRGGISNKFTDIDIENSLVVGAGLIEAYKLESSFAEVPRILLSQEVSKDKKIMSYFEKHSKKYGKNFSIFYKDTQNDDFYYLDYLGFILSFMNKSENQRLNIQDEFKDKYGMSKDIIEGLKLLLKEKYSEDFQKKTFKFLQKHKLSQKDIKKLTTMIKNSEQILRDKSNDINNIKHIKHTTIKTLSKLQEVISLHLNTYSDNQKILNKYIWLRKYLNNTIDKFPEMDFIQEYKIINEK